MSFKHAVLATLADGPLHGYAVRSALQARIGAFWPIGQGQVYATLERASRNGLTVDVDDGPTRRTHALSERGRRDLARWLGDSVGESAGEGMGFDDWLAHLAVAERRGDEPALTRTIAVQTRRCRTLKGSLSRQARDRLPTDAERLADELLRAELEWLAAVERDLARDGPPSA